MARFLEIHENDRKTLECPICKDWLVVPKVTRCNHIFCEACLTNYLEQHDCNCPPCPVCRERIILPKKGIQGFRTEHFYQSIIKRLNNSDDANSHRKIGVCGLCQVTAELTTKCLTCTCLICKQCSPLHNVLKPHCTVIPVSEIDIYGEDELMSQRNVVCRKHENELLSLYCGDCDKVICLLCKVTTHSEHQCESLHARAKFCRDWLENIQNELQNVIEDAKYRGKNINTILTDFLEELQDAENQGVNTIDLLIKTLNEKKSAFISSINDKRKDVSSRLQRQLDKVRNIETEANTLREIANKSFRFGVDSDVAALQKDMSLQFEQLKRELYSSLEKGFKLNVSFHEEEIEHLKEVLDAYTIGTLEYMQTVTTKAMKYTKVNPEWIAYCSMTSFGDSLYLKTHSNKSFFKWVYGEIKYDDTFEETVLTEKYDESMGPFIKNYTIRSKSNEGILQEYYPAFGCFQDIKSGAITTIDIAKVGFPYAHQYCSFAQTKNEEYIMFEQWTRSIHRLTSSGEIIQIIDNDFTKDYILNIDVNANDEILLLGQLKDGRGHCTVLKQDGSLKLRETFAEGYGDKPISVSTGCFDGLQNIVMRIESLKSKERVFVLLNMTTMCLERIILPLLPGVKGLQPSDVCKKCDSLLYLTVNKGNIILTVGYLP